MDFQDPTKSHILIEIPHEGEYKDRPSAYFYMADDFQPIDVVRGLAMVLRKYILTLAPASWPLARIQAQTILGAEGTDEEGNG